MCRPIPGRSPPGTISQAKFRDKDPALSEHESIGPSLRFEPSGRTVEGPRARSTLQSWGGSQGGDR
eukprot:scaffold4717_cov42-Phaeocystis_antarctica.AAC.1